MTTITRWTQTTSSTGYHTQVSLDTLTVDNAITDEEYNLALTLEYLAEVGVDYNDKTQVLAHRDALDADGDRRAHGVEWLAVKIWGIQNV